jgi:glycosyltransferase involved in cell wall biosynthesis
MKVLILTAMWPTSENPAFGSFVHSQAHHLERAGVEVDVLVLQGRSRKLIYPRGVIELRKRLAANPADVVHAHYGYVGWVVRTQWKAPVVVTFHGDDAQGTIGENGKTRPLSRVTAAFCRALGPLADAVIVQTERMARLFRGSNINVIPHEVDLEIFRPMSRSEARSRLGLSHEKKYILFAANPQIAVKRFPLAKAAWELLHGTDPTTELLVVCKETQDRLALYMNACNALVFPSYQEGSPNIIKQAMACNLPIVATDVGDVRDVIGATHGCHVCPPSPEEFAQAIKKLLCSPARTRGRERVQHLSGPLVAGRVIQVYEKTLRKRAKVLAASAQTES